MSRIDPSPTPGAGARHLSPHVQRPTIADLERETGYSRSTISRAFNPKAPVKEATRARIIEAADAIGFSLHPGARMIRSRRSFRWGLLLPHLENPEYGELIEAFDAEARRQGTTLMLGLTHYDCQVESAFLRHWAAGEVDGVVLDVVSWHENGDLYRQLLNRGFPFIPFYYAPDGFSVVNKNDFDTYCYGLRNLVDLGHRRIAYVGLSKKKAVHAKTFRAYEHVLEASGIPWDESLVIRGLNNQEAGMAAWRQLRALPDPPTAVLTFNDVIATGLWIGVHQDGLSVPQDLSIIGNGDIPESNLMELTTVRYDRADLARRVLASLDRKRENPNAEPETITMRTDLVMRRSVGPPRTRE